MQALGLEVREIQAVAVEDLRRLERHNLKMSKDMQKQVRPDKTGWISRLQCLFLGANARAKVSGSEKRTPRAR